MLKEPAWYEQARQLRRDGQTIKGIAMMLHKRRNDVSVVCKDVQCPIDHQRLQRINAARASHAPHVVRTQKPRVFVVKRDYKRPTLSKEERRHQEKMRRVRMVVRSWEQTSTPAPVTLPKLKFLELS